MYFHLVYSPEFYAVDSRRKLTRELCRQVTELMVTIVHEFIRNSESPSSALLSYSFHLGISSPLAYKGVLEHMWVRKT